MKETYYQFDKAQFKKYAKAYYAKNPDWKKKNAAAMLVVALGIAVMVVPPAFFITEDIVIALTFLVCWQHPSDRGHHHAKEGPAQVWPAV